MGNIGSYMADKCEQILASRDKKHITPIRNAILSLTNSHSVSGTDNSQSALDVCTFKINKSYHVNKFLIKVKE